MTVKPVKADWSEGVGILNFLWTESINRADFWCFSWSSRLFEWSGCLSFSPAQVEREASLKQLTWRGERKRCELGYIHSVCRYTHEKRSLLCDMYCYILHLTQCHHWLWMCALRPESSSWRLSRKNRTERFMKVFSYCFWFDNQTYNSMKAAGIHVPFLILQPSSTIRVQCIWCRTLSLRSTTAELLIRSVVGASKSWKAWKDNCKLCLKKSIYIKIIIQIEV